MNQLNRENSEIKLNNIDNSFFAFKFSQLNVERLAYEQLHKQISFLQPKANEMIWLHLFSKNMNWDDWTRSPHFIFEKAKQFLIKKNNRPCIHFQEHFSYGLLTDIPNTKIPWQSYTQCMIYFYCDKNFFITISFSNSKTINLLREEIINIPKYFESISLLICLIDKLNEGFICRVESLMLKLNEIEDKMLSNKKQKLRQQRAILNRTRHDLLIIKRLANPEQITLMPTHYSNVWLSKSSLLHLKQAINRFQCVNHILENLYERANLLHEELMSLLSDELNHKLLVLSIMSALLLPGTLISSIFGMNIPGLPGANSEHAFSILIFIMMGLAIFILVLLKRFKLW